MEEGAFFWSASCISLVTVAGRLHPLGHCHVRNTVEPSVLGVWTASPCETYSTFHGVIYKLAELDGYNMSTAAVWETHLDQLPLFPPQGQGANVPSDDDPYMDAEQVAAKVGITAGSVRMYLKRSRRRLAEGQELRAQDLPLPDITVSRSPAWLTSTIDAWINARPGRGRHRSNDPADL